MSEASLKRKMSIGDKQESTENDAQQDVPACSMHPDSYLFKGIGLLFICSIGLGSYFCYDGPGAMEVLSVFKKSRANSIKFIITAIKNYYIYFIYLPRKNLNMLWI